MARDVEVVFGAPGAGKTTHLLDIVDDHLASGGEPSRVAFVAFTRKAAREARERALARFGGLSAADAPWFRTLHSLAFRLMNLNHRRVLHGKALRDFGASVGAPISGSYGEGLEPGEAGTLLGDRCLRVLGLAAARGLPLRRVFDAGATDVGWSALATFADRLAAFKRARNLVDFTDMMSAEIEPLDVDLAIVDEAQDLTAQQWAFARRVFASTPRVSLGGDDQQAIFDWAGADPTAMGRVRGRRTFLTESHRVAAAPQALAARVAERIASGVRKTWRPRDAAGSVERVAEPEAVDLRADGTWLLLARTRHQILRLVEHARRQGVSYHHEGKWSTDDGPVRAAVAYERLRRGDSVPHGDAALVAGLCSAARRPRPGAEHHTADSLQVAHLRGLDWMRGLDLMDASDREYVRDLRRNEEHLSGPGRVVISTVHGAKGGEADNVLLLTDLTPRCDPESDGERRVLYVALTRCRERIVLVNPQGEHSWDV